MRRIATISLLLLSFSAAQAQVNYYYGNLHAHTGYSDGNKDSTTTGISKPGPSYYYAKQSYHMDFLGISEHNHNQAGMAIKSDYAKLKAQADTSTVNGTFAALYGMEWGVSTNDPDGHVLIYGTDSLIGWETVGGAPLYDIYVPKSDYHALWDSLKRRRNVWASLAHPDTYNYDSLSNTSRVIAYDSVVGGVSVRSGSAFSTTTTYTDPAASDYETFYRRMLAKGYRVAPTIDHDNHYTTFGRTGTGRTVIMASSLNRDTLLKSLRQMRFYASDDWNAQLSFTVNGNKMGSDINVSSNSTISVSITDPDAGEGVTSIQIYYGVPGSGNAATILTSNTGSTTLNYIHNTAYSNQYYYYAKITQSDTDVIWSAPIWVNRSIPTPVDILSFAGRAADAGNVLYWTVGNEKNIRSYEVQRSTNAIDFETVGTVAGGGYDVNGGYGFTDAGPTAFGTTYYRLAIRELDGQESFSSIIEVTRNLRGDFKLQALWPNPAGAILNVDYQAPASVVGSVRIYEVASGRQVQENVQALSPGAGRFQVPVNTLSPGSYLMVLFTPAGRVAEGHFVKQ